MKEPSKPGLIPRGAPRGPVRLAALVALALLAPTALAANESNPHVRDAAGDAPDPAKDLLALWFENEPGGVRFTLKVASVERTPTMTLYYVGFRLDGEPHSVGVGFEGSGRQRTSIDTPSGWFNGLNDGLRDAKLRLGTPAYVSALIPFENLPGLEGALLTSLEGGVASNEDGGPWETEVDTLGSPLATFRVSGDRSAWPGWAMGLGVAALGVGAVFLARRARRTKRVPVLAPAAPPPPPEPPFDPDSPRFRLDPRDETRPPPPGAR